TECNLGHAEPERTDAPLVLSPMTRGCSFVSELVFTVVAECERIQRYSRLRSGQREGMLTELRVVDHVVHALAPKCDVGSSISSSADLNAPGVRRQRFAVLRNVQLLR